jgi:hypothetical protein
VAGVVVAMTILAARLQAQFVSTDITNGLNEPYGVTTDGANNVYLTDAVNNRVVKFIPGASTVINLAGLSGLQNYGTNNGVGTAARFNQPQGIVYAPGRGGLVVADQNNQELRFVSLGGAVSNLAGVAGTYGTNNGPALGGALLSSPTGLAVDHDGITIYIADKGNNAIRMLTTNNMISNVPTGGYRFNAPAGIAVDNNDNLWVADSLNQVIVMITNGVVTVMAGQSRVIGTNDSLTATSATFNLPTGIVWDGVHGLFAITDTRNNTVRSLFLTNVLGVNGYAVQTIGGFAGVQGFVDGALGVAKFYQPEGICYDVIDSGYYVIDTGNNALRVVQATQPPPAPVAVTNPVIGYVSFPLVSGSPGAQFNPITAPISTFNNPVVLAIEQLDPTVQTYMSYGATGSVITPPGTNTAHVTAYTAADDGLAPGLIPNLGTPLLPSLTLEAISLGTGRPSSSPVSAQINYVTANPNIIGQNGQAVQLLDVTSNAQMWYTLDGSAPVPGATNTFPPSSTAGITSGQIISFVPGTNTILTVQALATNFAPSGLVTATFSISNYMADEITFGFATGEGSSKFICAPGQTFIAPVTLSLIPTDETILSMQFNLAISNVTAPAVPTSGANALTFSSMLEEPLPGSNPTIYVPIPPAMFVNGGFTNLLFSNVDLLGVGWLERAGSTNLYNTQQQTLVTYSQAHDTMFLSGGGQVIVGAFSFHVPTTATAGQTYEIQIGSPSATSDGISKPVFMLTVTNGSMTNGAVNSIKTVTVGTNAYLVGDTAPFSWFNGGDFGDGTLQNNDVTEVFQVAAYGLDGPDAATATSDYFDAMDSSNGNYSGLYDGTDTLINNITLGDGVIAVDDIYVTYRRSLDPSLTWYNRYDSATGKQAYAVPNLLPVLFSSPAPVASGSATPTGPVHISVAGDQVQANPGNLTVHVPVRLTAGDTRPLRVMALDLQVQPLDGSPAVTAAVTFSAVTNLGTPAMSSSKGANDFAAAWLDSTVSGVAGAGVLGTLTVTLPPTVTTNSSYLVHFGNFSASPNGLALFHPTLQDGLITVGDRSASSWKDGISDSWRLLWFGTVSNMVSAANADPDGDGASNWAEYVAGTNPNDATSVFKFAAGGTYAPSAFSLQWPSVINKHYSVQARYNLTTGDWYTLATNIVGTGQVIQWTDNSASGKSEFYRAIVQ